jgi:fluoroacetyl-CoA thioesterase
MKDSLAPGLGREERHTVTAAMAPPHLPVKVLGTPMMIQLIEQNCLLAAAEHLDDGETTVGVHVCVSHDRAAPEGDEVTVRCRLAEVDRRRLTFEVEVEGAAGKVSEGTHQRAVIQTSRFG